MGQDEAIITHLILPYATHRDDEQRQVNPGSLMNKFYLKFVISVSYLNLFTRRKQTERNEVGWRWRFHFGRFYAVYDLDGDNHNICTSTHRNHCKKELLP